MKANRKRSKAGLSSATTFRFVTRFRDGQKETIERALTFCPEEEFKGKVFTVAESRRLALGFTSKVREARLKYIEGPKAPEWFNQRSGKFLY